MKKNTRQKKSKRDSRGFPFFWALILLVLLTEIFLYAWCRVQCVRLRYEIGRERSVAARLESERKALRVELVKLKTPARIMALAEKEIGLIMPEIDQIVVLP